MEYLLGYLSMKAAGATSCHLYVIRGQSLT